MMSNFKKYENYFKIAGLYASQGNCLKRNYGCVIMDPDGNIVSAGNTHSEVKCVKCKRRFSRSGHNYEKCTSIHAEQEAIVGVKIPAGSVAFLYCIDGDGVCVSNPRPCPICSRLLKQAGIKEVITLTEVISL